MTLCLSYFSQKTTDKKSPRCAAQQRFKCCANKGQSVRKKEFLGTRRDCLQPNKTEFPG